MFNPYSSAERLKVNLSTASSSSSSALLQSIRAERAAREHQRKLELAAVTVQRIWRARCTVALVHSNLLDAFESGSETRPGALAILLRSTADRHRVLAVLERRAHDQSLSLGEDPVIRAILAARILNLILDNPRTTQAATLLGMLEAQLKPNSEVAETLGRVRWIKTCVDVLDMLISENQPKKKHPSIQPVIRLITAPLAGVTVDSPFMPPIVYCLLTVPSLPSSIPLPSLTHLSIHLPLFTVVLPAAAKYPAILSQGRLGTEIGKTFFLANLSTFGITGGMLPASGSRGASAWINVIGTVLSGVREGWGRWVEGNLKMELNSNNEENMTVSRPPIPNLAPKLFALATPAHLSTIATFVSGNITEFSAFVLALLHAFRGSPRWESILDSTLQGRKGKALVKQLWREGVRGKWNRSAWDGFEQSTDKSTLILLTHLYCHYLLLTPDDEFFAPESNPLSLDEVLDLSAVWRDLAFWGYMNGVSPQFEEARALFRRGVTRVCERNARRPFAAEDFWVMSSEIDLRGFVEAAVLEDEELAEQRKLSRRQIAYLAPRLGLLNNLPMAVPFQTRLEVFRQFIKADRERLKIDRYMHGTRHRVTIRRTHLAEDGFRNLNALGSLLKDTIQITFIDQWDMEERGIDGGGLFKEFLTELSKEAFDTERGLWLSNSSNELYPNPHSYATESHQLSWYGFIGRVLGKALYEDILVDVSFAAFFLAKWLGRQSYLDDLNSLDKDLYKGLIILKNYPKPEELDLNFTITEQEFGVARSVDLLPGGSEIAVTAENRHEYIQSVCKYKLDWQISAQSRAFFAGLSDIIDPNWLRMFDQHELSQLVGGEEKAIDIRDLRKNSEVSGFSDSATPTMFWKVVKGFTQEEKRALLRFVTSCSRPPLLGFAHLNPKFGIRSNGNDTNRLPTASACANLLKLPDYKDENMLRTKLLQAITSGTGFEMS